MAGPGQRRDRVTLGGGGGRKYLDGFLHYCRASLGFELPSSALVCCPAVQSIALNSCPKLRHSPSFPSRTQRYLVRCILYACDPRHAPSGRDTTTNQPRTAGSRIRTLRSKHVMSLFSSVGLYDNLDDPEPFFNRKAAIFGFIIPFLVRLGALEHPRGLVPG